MGVFAANFVHLALLAFWLLFLGRVLLSWFDPGGRSPLAGFVFSATEPVLAPIRRVLPPTGSIDFSPMIVLIVLGLLQGAI